MPSRHRLPARPQADGRVPCVACLATARWRVTWLEPSLSPVIPGPIERDDPSCDRHLVDVARTASDHNAGALLGVRRITPTTKDTST